MTKTNRRRKMVIAVAMVTALVGTVGCKEENHLAEEAQRMIFYQRNQSDGNLLALAKVQGEVINENVKNKTEQAGIYADYGLCLAKLGLQEEGNKWMNKEMSVFPASTTYVKALKTKYAGAYASDCSSLPSSRKTDEKTLASFMFNDADEELEPVFPDVSDEFSDDPASIVVTVDQNPEMSEKEVQALELSKYAKTDEEKALSAEERAKAKKQAAKEKEKAKKQAAKEKEKAKKQAAKEKAKAKKQAEKEKAIAKEQAAKEKEAAKRQAAKEKEQAREKAALQKEAERARLAAEKAQQREEAAAERQRQREAAAAERQRQREEAAAERQRQKEEAARQQQEEDDDE